MMNNKQSMNRVVLIYDEQQTIHEQADTDISVLAQWLAIISIQ